MANTIIVPATPDHIALLAPRMRPADRDEVWASGHMTPEEALRRSLRLSTHAWTLFIEDEPLAMWGVAPLNLLAGVGAPWLLSTDAVDRYPRAFLRHCRSRFSDLFRVYPILRSYVDDRHTVAKRWLAWLGFTLGEPEPWGADGLPFRPFMTGRFT
ncbi:MAG: hypothetical protein FD153_2 [Rhodospirillaceae bacterium]|nr:MAG: hypothetical protein FD153_2 [Rhodospirillaceae bacterium]